MIRRSIACVVALLLVITLASSAWAKTGGTDRPIWANLSGEVNFYPQSDPDCPIVTVSDSYGTMSHFGNVWIHWTHCPPVTQPLYTNLHLTITTANGDKLFGTYDINGEGPYPMDISGGTGRFAGATGHLHTEFQLEGEWANGFPVSPWQGWWQLKGTISY